jgi:hypothetical protein
MTTNAQLASATTESSASSSVTASGDLSPVVLQHLERMRRMNRSWMRLSLKGEDGKSLNLRLGLNGERVAITVFSSDEGLQERLVRNWPRLNDQARRRGMHLESPRFAVDAATGRNSVVQFS